MTQNIISHNTIILILLLFPCMFEVEGLTLKLIITAPNYSNLNEFERMERFASQSQARARKFRAGKVAAQPTIPVTRYGPYDNMLFLAEIGIGTFKDNPSFRSYFLGIDTATSLLWVQCEECRAKGNQCFPAVDPPFPDSQSYTYKPIMKHDRSCPSKAHFINYVENDDICHYHAYYDDGIDSTGQLSYESFTFGSETGKSVSVNHIMFGCGFNQPSKHGEKVPQPLKLAGILGLSRGPLALQNQLDPAGIGLNFSYCFTKFFNVGNDDQFISYLRFGEDISHDTGFLHTPFQSVPNTEQYYIKVIDIMVNGHQLQIPAPIFEVKKDRSGGVIVDSGNSITGLVKPAFDLLEKYLVSIFSANKNYRRKPAETKHPKLCYYMRKPEGYINLPTIVFILEKGNLEIAPEQGFFVGKYEGQEFFCLMMQPLDVDDGTVIGAYQQVNHRFIYDAKQKMLWFKTDDCARNP